MSKKTKKQICCLCGKEIEIEPFGWAFGNNPWPLGKNENDRCCNICNESKVIPARIKLSHMSK